MDVLTATRRASVLPVDPYLRAAFLRTKIGSYITLSSGDFEMSGVLVSVLDPAIHAENPVPVVVIDTGVERVAGPVITGDRLT